MNKLTFKAAMAKPAETSANSANSTPIPPPTPSHGGANSATSANSTGIPPLPEDDDADGLTPEEMEAMDEVSTNSANSTAPHIREHPIPEDSILATYRDFAREVSEAPDGWLVAPILALCGKLLTPRVWLDFGGRKPLTIFNFIAGPAGLRKSTTFKPAEAIAERILAPSDWANGAASESALFSTFEKQPHRLCFEDEANPTLRAWQSSAPGKEVSARFLKLYDGSAWHQNYLRNKDDGGEAERSIAQATLSLCFGCTFGAANLHGIDAASGLRRRFGYYLATAAARFLDWPDTLDGGEIDFHADNFAKLATLEGVITRHAHFSPTAWNIWKGIQRRNRERCTGIVDSTAAAENLAASLNESPSRILKLAAIFGACRWAAGNQAEPLAITPENLELAEAHQNACLDALEELETVGRRAQIADEAEAIYASIVSTATPEEVAKGEMFRSKTQLTHRLASNPGRAGAMKPSHLYNAIFPHLIRQGKARVAERDGKRVVYGIKIED